jgi:prepilin-type N-terminal cleavage/methylation domain-containing protein
LRSRSRKDGAFTLIEVLTVLVIIGLLAGLTAGVTGAIRSSRASTGVQQVVAFLDSARARSIAKQKWVAVTFATTAANPLVEPFRGMLMVEQDESQVSQPELITEAQFIQVSEWVRLPEGFALSTSSPASNNAGVNALVLSMEPLRVKSPQGQEQRLVGVVFGSSGEVVYPPLSQGGGRPLLLAIFEGTAGGGTGMQTAAECRWISIQRHSGASMILP